MNGIVGRARGSMAGYTYSEAMASVQTPWTGDELYAFLKAPKEYVPGTKMGFAGIAAPQDRANLIAYLATTK
jgi:cytochrome c